MLIDPVERRCMFSHFA